MDAPTVSATTGGQMRQGQGWVFVPETYRDAGPDEGMVPVPAQFKNSATGETRPAESIGFVRGGPFGGLTGVLKNPVTGELVTAQGEPYTKTGAELQAALAEGATIGKQRGAELSNNSNMTFGGLGEYMLPALVAAGTAGVGAWAGGAGAAGAAGGAGAMDTAGFEGLTAADAGLSGGTFGGTFGGAGGASAYGYYPGEMGALGGAGGAGGSGSLADFLSSQGGTYSSMYGVPQGAALSDVAAGIGGAGSAASGLGGLLGGSGGSGMGGLAQLLGIGTGLNSLFGTPSSSSMGNYGQGAGAAASLGALQQTQPADFAAYQKLLGIDTSGITNAANQAGQQFGGLANQAQNYSGILGNQANVNMGAQQSLMGAGNAAFSAGQDPQQALYARTLQQVQDQSRASTSVRGIGMSPEAAGIENQATSNFNIDWQNQQLSRMLAGLGGMTSAYQGAGAQGQGAQSNLGQSAAMGALQPGYTQASGQVPYAGQVQAASAPISAGNQYTGAITNAFNPQLGGFNQSQAAAGQAQSAAGTNALLTGLYGYNPNSALAPFAAQNQGNQSGSWLSNLFGGQSATSGGMQAPTGNPTYYGG